MENMKKFGFTLAEVLITLGIIGVVAYLYLSEAGARYAIMYAPIVFAMMGWTLSEIKKI